MKIAGDLDVLEMWDDVDDYELPKYSTPGRILFRAEPEPTGPYRYDIEVLGYDAETSVFWLNEGQGIEYWIDSCIDLFVPGAYVIEGVTGYYSRGDGWTNDDDEDWEYDSIRPATIEEISNETLY